MQAQMTEIYRGKNLHLAGWTSGYLIVQFRGRSDQYDFGPGVPEDAVEKLRRNPYPDRLFSSWKKKFNWPCKKLEEA